MRKRSPLAALALSLATALLSCSLPAGEPAASGEAGGLVVELGGARLIAPGLDLKVASYEVSGTGPEGASFKATGPGPRFEIKKLAFGDWVVTVRGFNAAGAVVGSGFAPAVVRTGETNSVPISVRPLEGEGTLSLGVKWNAADLDRPSVKARLAPAAGEAMDLAFALDGATAAYSGEVPAGYYTLSVQLLDNGIVVAGAVDVVRVAKGALSAGSFEFKEVNKPGGTIEVLVDLAMADPLEVALKTTSGVGPAYAASVPEGTNATFVWYVNGESAAVGPTFSLAKREAAFYRVDVIGFTADGTRAGSATTSIRTISPLQGDLGTRFTRTETYPGIQKPALSDDQMAADLINIYKALRTKIVPFYFVDGAREAAGDGYVLRAGANGDIDGWPADLTSVTQSEAHGYAMLMMVLLNDIEPMAREVFDGLYRVSVNFPSADDERVMSWIVPGTGDFSAKKQASATDGDMDMAYALIMASKLWDGGPGYGLSYLDAAKRAIAGLKANNVLRGEGPYFPRMGIGDHLGYHNYDLYKATRPCDLMVDHFDAFAAVTGDPEWTAIADVAANLIIPEMQSGARVLLPDFLGSPTDAPTTIAAFKGISDEAGGIYDDLYYYNSCRVPWRFAVGYAHTKREGLKASVDKINDWLVSKPQHQRNGVFNPGSTIACYTLEGEFQPSFQGGWTWYDTCFMAPWTAGLSLAGPDKLDALTASWNRVKRPANSYYSDSLALLSLLYVSGNWWDPLP